MARDLNRCYELESTAYEGDEAATYEKIAARIEQYPEGFLVMERDGQLIGFIISVCAETVVMSDEEFKELVGHSAVAPNVVIMSVVVNPNHQGIDYASELMRHFGTPCRAIGKATINLMCKKRHVASYTKLGYQYVQSSLFSHGGMVWHEMVMTL